MTGMPLSMEASTAPCQSLLEVLSDANSRLHKVLEENKMSMAEAGLVMSLIKGFVKQTACDATEDEEVYIQYWIDHYQKKGSPRLMSIPNSVADCRSTIEKTVPCSQLDMAYRIGRKDLIKLVYKFFTIRREVDWLRSLPILPPKAVNLSSRSLSVSTIASNGRAEPSSTEPVLKPISTMGSLPSAFGGSHSEDRRDDTLSKLLQYTRVIDLFIACDADCQRLGDDGIIPKDAAYRPSFFEGESKLVASDVSMFFNSIRDKAKWGLKGVVETDLLDYLHNFIDGFEEAFPILDAFEKQHGYRSIDVSSLFRFWASLTPYQKSSYRLRGPSRSQALDVITKVAEREIKQQREAADFAEQAAKDSIDKSKLRYLHILPTPLFELARPKKHTMNTDSELALMQLFQLLKKRGPNDSKVMAALAEYKDALGPHHSYDAFGVLLKQARKLRMISNIDSPSGRLPLAQGNEADVVRMSELYEALQRHAALKRKVYTIVNHSVSRASDLFGVTSGGFLEHLFAELCQTIGEDRICDLFGCREIDRSARIRVNNAAIDVGEDGIIHIEMKTYVPVVEVRIDGGGLIFDVLAANDKILGRSDAKGIARFVAFEKRLSIKMSKGCTWRGEEVEVSKLWKIAPPQFVRYCSDTLTKRIQSHRRWALSCHGLGFWAPLGRSVGTCFNHKVHLSIEVNKASQYDHMVARLGGGRLARRVRGSTFMLNGEIDNCRFIPAAGGHAPGNNTARRRSRTIDDFVASLGAKSDNAQAGCYNLIRRWGRLKRAKALCQQGYMLAAKTYLDKAFNVGQIMEHFSCMYPGCLKPLDPSTTACKCRGMFCDTHWHPRCHSCHETGLRLKSIMSTVSEMSDEKCGIEEAFDDRTMLGLLLHVLEVSRTIKEGLKRRRWGRIPGTTGREDPPPGQFWRSVNAAKVYKSCVGCGTQPEAARSLSEASFNGGCSRCSFTRRNVESDRKLLRRARGRQTHQGSTKSTIVTESDALERFRQLRTSMAKAQKSSVERLSKPRPRPKAPQLSLVRRFKARPVPSSIDGRPSARSRPTPATLPVVATSSGRAGEVQEVAQSIVNAIVKRPATSECLSTPSIKDTKTANAGLHLELSGLQNSETKQEADIDDLSGVVDATLVDASDESEVLPIDDKLNSSGGLLLPVIVEDPSMKPSTDPQSAIAEAKNEAERWAQLSPRELPVHNEEGLEPVYDPKKYTDDIVESDWLVERTAPSSLSATRATELQTKDSLSALFSNSMSPVIEQTEGGGEDLEKLFASVDLNSL